MKAMQNSEKIKDAKSNIASILKLRSENFNLRYRAVKDRNPIALKLMEDMENEGIEFRESQGGISVLSLLAMENDQDSIDFLLSGKVPYNVRSYTYKTGLYRFVNVMNQKTAPELKQALQDSKKELQTILQKNFWLEEAGQSESVKNDMETISLHLKRL